ncbi:MAG: hypothetical protein KJ914_14335 [Gammaproteobacteria bacterium]|nr:hypothetical protein [Gammaproteobacteria bacterium]MBU1723387.1 hypothetical protein [Gammaproteobacteria bacterium]MBU2006969.1 hypothetical protein [Gammaproteobacteria bacterium]
MTELVTFLSGHTNPDSKAPMDAWTLARKRANDYLKLHNLPEAEREHLLTRITHKLARAPLCPEQELIRHYLSLAQEELALLQTATTDGSCCQCKKSSSKTGELITADGKPETRTQTGPRFQRSSIRVAPLKAITLLPSSSRLRTRHF